jgi:hypothetical protein
MFRHAVTQYCVHKYIMDIYVCEKCKFTLFIDSPSYYSATHDFKTLNLTSLVLFNITSAHSTMLLLSQTKLNHAETGETQMP